MADSTQDAIRKQAEDEQLPLIIDSVYNRLPLAQMPERNAFLLMTEAFLTSLFYGDGMWDTWAQANNWQGYVSPDIQAIAPTREIKAGFGFDFSEAQFTDVSAETVSDDVKRLDVMADFASVRDEITDSTIKVADAVPAAELASNLRLG